MDHEHGAHPQGSPAEIYEKYLVPAIFAQWVKPLTDLAGVKPGDRVLDVGCGTGVVTRAVSVKACSEGTVTGQDVNPGMLAVARSHASPDGAPIEWHECDAASLPFPDGSFDVVLGQQVLQFIPDKPGALLEMRRVLVPGGRLALAIWRSTAHSPGWAALEGALARHIGEEAAQLVPFSLGDAEELRRLVQGAGFQGITIREESRPSRFASPEAFVHQVAGGAPTMLKPLATVGETERQTVIDEVGEALRPFIEQDGLVFPQEAHLVIAYA